MTQNATVLRALREAGRLGVHSFTLRRDLFVGNPSQRIAELEALGHEISSVPEKLHGRATGCRYKLVRDAGGTGGHGAKAFAGPVSFVAEDLPGGGEVDGRLFDAGRPDPTPHWAQDAA